MPEINNRPNIERTLVIFVIITVCKKLSKFGMFYLSNLLSLLLLLLSCILLLLLLLSCTLLLLLLL